MIDKISSLLGTNSGSQDQGELHNVDKETTEQVEVSCWAEDDLVLFRWKELLPEPTEQHSGQQLVCFQSM